VSATSQPFGDYRRCALLQPVQLRSHALFASPSVGALPLVRMPAFKVALGSSCPDMKPPPIISPEMEERPTLRPAGVLLFARFR
jgi:hypothetical protein